jgi:hypothetical protein
LKLNNEILQLRCRCNELSELLLVAEERFSNKALTIFALNRFFEKALIICDFLAGRDVPDGSLRRDGVLQGAVHADQGHEASPGQDHPQPGNQLTLFSQPINKPEKSRG